MRERVERELHRIRHGTQGTQPTAWAPCGFTVVTDGAESSEWEGLLPRWFVEACAPEMTPEEAQRWLARWEKLSDEERRAEEEGKPWALADWLHWMEPERRSWWWWDAVAADEAQVRVQVDEWPFPWGALAWLLRAAGANDVIPEE